MHLIAMVVNRELNIENLAAGFVNLLAERGRETFNTL